MGGRQKPYDKDAEMWGEEVEARDTLERTAIGHNSHGKVGREGNSVSFSSQRMHT